MQHTAGSQATDSGITKNASSELAVIVSAAACLARSGTARWWRQFITIGPNRRCSTIQRSQVALPREKQKAASSTNGTVGSTGITTPTSPASRLAAPPMNQRMRIQVGQGRAADMKEC